MRESRLEGSLNPASARTSRNPEQSLGVALFQTSPTQYTKDTVAVRRSSSRSFRLVNGNS